MRQAGSCSGYGISTRSKHALNKSLALYWGKVGQRSKDLSSHLLPQSQHGNWLEPGTSPFSPPSHLHLSASQGLPASKFFTQLAQVPEAERSARFWICKAKMLAREGSFDVTELYEAAVRAGAEVSLGGAPCVCWESQLPPGFGIGGTQSLSLPRAVQLAVTSGALLFYRSKGRVIAQKGLEKLELHSTMEAPSLGPPRLSGCSPTGNSAFGVWPPAFPSIEPALTIHFSTPSLTAHPGAAGGGCRSPEAEGQEISR